MFLGFRNALSIIKIIHLMSVIKIIHLICFLFYFCYQFTLRMTFKICRHIWARPRHSRGPRPTRPHASVMLHAAFGAHALLSCIPPVQVLAQLHTARQLPRSLPMQVIRPNTRPMRNTLTPFTSMSARSAPTSTRRTHTPQTAHAQTCISPTAGHPLGCSYFFLISCFF